MRKILLFFLALICLFSICACSDTGEHKGNLDKLPIKPTDSFEMDPEEEAELYHEDIAEDDEDEQEFQHSPYKFPNQYRNSMYFFEQGYPEGWTISAKENGNYSVEKEKLLIVINNNNDSDSARYCIYKQGDDDILPDGTSSEAVYDLVINPDCDLYFNKNMGTRDDFVFTNQEPIESLVNGVQYYLATYTFTKNGQPWQGEFYVLAQERQYFVVAYEAATEKWEQFGPVFMEMFEDFKPEWQGSVG